MDAVRYGLHSLNWSPLSVETVRGGQLPFQPTFQDLRSCSRIRDVFPAVTAKITGTCLSNN